MSSAVSTALAINASVQASVAAQQAHEANVNSCMAYMSSYNPKGATPQEAKQYSHCVSTVYPQEISIDIPGKLLVGTCLLAVLIAFLIGVYHRHSGRGWMTPGWAEVSIGYPLMGCLAWGILWLIAAGIMYLFS